MSENIELQEEVAVTEAKKPKRKFSDTMFAGYLLTFLLMFVGQIIGGISVALIPVEQESGPWETGSMYLMFWGIWALTIWYIYLTRKNRPILRAIGTEPSGNNWRLFLLGILFGFGLNGFCILIAWLHKDIYLYYDSFWPIALILIFITVLIQSSAEELLCRGFLYQRLRKSYRHPAVAIVGNSLFFALLHLMNDGVTVLSIVNIFLTGIFFSLMVYYLDSIWCAFAAHTAWNYTQNIIFGLPNSGIVVPTSIYKLDASTAMDSFAYNVGFGIEGTVVADIVLLAACLGLFLWGRKHGKQELNIWQEDSAY